MVSVARKPSSPDGRVAVAAAARKLIARRSFKWFVSHVWSTIEPTRALVPSIALDAITAALQAVADGRIKRLAIACPPGVSKSLAGTVAFPAYLELKSDGSARIMCGTYSHAFALRDATRCRDLITSSTFRDLVDGAWSIRADANRVDDVWFTGGGRRIVVTSDGKSMGERCTFQIIDDALSSKEAHSAAAKRDALRWVNEMLPSRLEDQDNDPRVLIGQMLSVDDVMSSAIERGWSVLRLPAILGEDDEPCILLDDQCDLVWRDERGPGVPLLELLSAEALDRLLVDMGPSAFAAQYMQKPQDDSASMFKRDWFTRRWTELPDKFDRVVISLDASFKEGDSSDYAVIQVWGALKGDRYLIDQWRRRAGFHDTSNALRAMRERFLFAKVVVEEAANGHAVVDMLKREMPGIIAVKPEGGKSSRAATVEPICAAGSIVLPEIAPWVPTWIDEVTSFGPNAKHDDQVDAMVYALRELQQSSAAANWRAMSRA